MTSLSELAVTGVARSRVLGIIPARLASQRLPRKLLREVAGRPLLAWTVEAAQRCPQFDDLLVAVDSPEVAALCERHGWSWQMTSPELASGTDRLAALASDHDASIYVNVQGDEPLITPHHIAALLAPFEDPSVDVTTLKVACTLEERSNPNAVKVVTALDGRALYFSRATIPFARDKASPAPLFKHLGLYAYRKRALERFAKLPPGHLEEIEKLEQLRLLEHGLTLHVREVEQATRGVDTEEDLYAVAPLLLARQHSRQMP